MYDIQARASIRLMNSHNNNEQMPSPLWSERKSNMRELYYILYLSHQVKKTVRDKSLDVYRSSSIVCPCRSINIIRVISYWLISLLLPEINSDYFLSTVQRPLDPILKELAEKR